MDASLMPPGLQRFRERALAAVAAPPAPPLEVQVEDLSERVAAVEQALQLEPEPEPLPEPDAPPPA
jgi:hypothetical protein